MQFAKSVGYLTNIALSINVIGIFRIFELPKISTSVKVLGARGICGNTNWTLAIRGIRIYKGMVINIAIFQRPRVHPVQK